MERGALVTFSGLDGSGKSTQIRLVADHLQRLGRAPALLWTRGGYTPRLEQLKAWLRRLAGRRLPPPGRSAHRDRALRRAGVRRVWLAAALLDLVWTYGVQVRYWRARGRVVVCDRYLWDTLVDFRLNFPGEPVERWRLWRWLVAAAPTPDLALLLSISVDESVARSDRKGEPFRDSRDVLARRLEQYDQLAPAARWRIVDGTRPQDAVFDEVRALVEAAVSRRDAAQRPASTVEAP